MLWEILEPVDKSKIKFFNKLVELAKEPRILWYPSAGEDYRDILELSEISLEDLDIPSNITDGREILQEINRKYNCNFKRLTIAYDHNIKREELPNLFIHTDYNKNFTPKKGVAFDDGKTKVTIKELCELKIVRDIRYNVNECYAFTELAYKEPKIYLLDVELESNVLGKINKPLIYFMFENINFLEEVLIKQKIKVPYILKVRDGYGSKGGGKISMAVIYAFLSILNTKYLICDYCTMEEYELKDLIEKIASRLGLEKGFYEWYSYTLKKLSQEDIRWSGLWVNIYKVNIIRGEKFEIEKFFKEIIAFLNSKESKIS